MHGHEHFYPLLTFSPEYSWNTFFDWINDRMIFSEIIECIFCKSELIFQFPHSWKINLPYSRPCFNNFSLSLSWNFFVFFRLIQNYHLMFRSLKLKSRLWFHRILQNNEIKMRAIFNFIDWTIWATQILLLFEEIIFCKFCFFVVDKIQKFCQQITKFFCKL